MNLSSSPPSIVNVSGESDSRRELLLRDFSSKEKDRKDEEKAIKALSDMLSNGIKCS